jgi:hypothetical protein
MTDNPQTTPTYEEMSPGEAIVIHFLNDIEEKTVEAMEYLGPVWTLANTRTKVHQIFEDLSIRARKL